MLYFIGIFSVFVSRCSVLVQSFHDANGDDCVNKQTLMMVLCSSNAVFYINMQFF